MLVYSHIGDLSGNPTYPNLGDPKRAVEAYRIMMDMARNLHEANSADQGATIDYGMALSRAAIIPSQPLDARAELFRKSHAVLEEAAAHDPANTMVRMNLASVHEQLADILYANGRREEARTEYRAALALAETNLGSAFATYRIAITCARQLALDAVRRGDASQALDYGDRAVIAGESAAARKEAPVVGRTLAPRAWAAMGDICEALHRSSEARRWRKRSLAGFLELRDLPGFPAAQRDMILHLEQELERN
jgi:tetratricopeptide (TPR) repeat protein